MQQRDPLELVKERSGKGLLRYRVGPQMTLREIVWMTLDDPTFNKLSMRYSFFSIFLIAFSSTTFLLSTEINCKLKVDAAFGAGKLSWSYGHTFVTADNCASWEAAWSAVELVAVVCFTLELVLRFATTPNHWRFVKAGFNWIDLMAVLPYYVEVIAMAIKRANDDDTGAQELTNLLKVLRVLVRRATL